MNMDGIDHILNIGVNLANELAPDHELNEDGVNIRLSRFQEAKTQVDAILNMHKTQEKALTGEVAALNDMLTQKVLEFNQ